MNPVNTKPYILPPDATWLITGCSSGIGCAIATLIASMPSHRLIATARDPATLSYLPENANIFKLALDVTKPASISAAFTAATAHFGDSFHLDVIVNNAGYSLSGDTESATEIEMHDELETNFFGTVRVALKAVEIMRQHTEQRGGIVFNMSSLAGVCAFPGHAFYHASKYAVEGWTESVAREMHPDWNINFCLIEPGGVKTSFEGHSKAHTAAHPAYASADMPARKLEKYVNTGLAAGVGVEPSAVAERIYQVASRGEQVPLRLPLTKGAHGLMVTGLQGRLKELEEVKTLSDI